MAYINKVTLLGTISKYGVEVRFVGSGTACASLQLVVEEVGQDGKPHPVYVPVEIWGKKAEDAGTLDAGELCLLEGRLAKKRKGDTWELIVSSYQLQPFTAPLLARKE